MDLEFSGTYTQEQVRHAIRLLNKPSGWWGWTKRLIGPVFLLVLLGLLLYAVVSGVEITTYRIVRTGTVLLLLGYYTVSPYLTASRLVNQLWGRLKLQGVQRGLADGRGVAWQGALGSSETGWEKFARLSEDETLLELVTEDGTLHIFPREFFNTQADWTRFRQMAQQRVKVIH